MAVEGSPAPGSRRLDRVLGVDYLSGLRDIELPELRHLRREAEQEEVDLSYLRRMIQGRLDIVRAEQQRRAGGADASSVVSGLSDILADERREPPRGLGRHSVLEPSRADSHRRHVEALVANVDLADLSARTDSELTEAIELLSGEEQRLSALRRDVQQVADACSAELTRRYRDGEADVGSLLQPSSDS